MHNLIGGRAIPSVTNELAVRIDHDNAKSRGSEAAPPRVDGRAVNVPLVVLLRFTMVHPPFKPSLFVALRRMDPYCQHPFLLQELLPFHRQPARHR